MINRNVNVGGGPTVEPGIAPFTLVVAKPKNTKSGPMITINQFSFISPQD